MQEIPQIKAPDAIRIAGESTGIVLRLIDCKNASEVLDYIKMARNCTLPTENIIV